MDVTEIPLHDVPPSQIGQHTNDRRPERRIIDDRMSKGGVEWDGIPGSLGTVAFPSTSPSVHHRRDTVTENRRTLNIGQGQVLSMHVGNGDSTAEQNLTLPASSSGMTNSKEI